MRKSFDSLAERQPLSQRPLTFAVTLGPFFFSSADEPFGKARKINDPTMTVTATRNFILLSQSLTINKKKKSSPERTAWKSC